MSITGNSKLLGHILALFTVFIWGITFVSSKLLLEYFTPLTIMVLRFSLAYIGLWIIHPKFYKVKSMKEEFVFIAAGATGVAGYFFMENTALMFTTVSNTGLILAAVPLFVAIVTHVFTPDEHFHINLLYGFGIAMIGVALVIFNGQVNLSVNPLGDFLALMAGVVWAFYSLAIKKMDQNYSPVYLTRRTFFYGILIGGTCLFAFEGGADLSPLFKTNSWMHISFLGLIASASCYVFWNKAIRLIGAVKTSSYIYLMPVFTMAASYIVLNEIITGLMLIGCLFILLGVYVSENGFRIRKNKEVKNESRIST